MAKLIQWLGLLLVTLLITSFVVGLIISITTPSTLPDWTGLAASTERTISTKGTEVTTTIKEQSPKTLWDWAGLLIVPLVLALGGLWFNQQEKQRDTYREEQRAQDTALQSYLAQMTNLLLDKNLLLSTRHNEIRSVARAQTLAVLRMIDGARKATVLQFLYETKLIGYRGTIGTIENHDKPREEVIIVILQDADLTDVKQNDSMLLAGADLEDTNLSRAYLPRTVLHNARLLHANLSDTNLSDANLGAASIGKANLSRSDLRGADLSNAVLSGAILNKAQLRKADLTNADLSDADLSQANLDEAILRNANISGAKLDGANLRNSNLTKEQLNTAKSYKGAKLPFEYP